MKSQASSMWFLKNQLSAGCIPPAVMFFWSTPSLTTSFVSHVDLVLYRSAQGQNEARNRTFRNTSFQCITTVAVSKSAAKKQLGMFPLHLGHGVNQQIKIDLQLPSGKRRVKHSCLEYNPVSIEKYVDSRVHFPLSVPQLGSFWQDVLAKILWSDIA